MRIARVALFFNCTFRRSEPGSPLIPCMLALVNRLREFTVPEARKSHAPYITYTLTCSNRTQLTAEGPLQERGTRISYECNPIRDLQVIPAANIITRACLAPCNLDGIRNTAPFLTGSMFGRGYFQEEGQTRPCLAGKDASSLSQIYGQRRSAGPRNDPCLCPMR